MSRSLAKVVQQVKCEPSVLFNEERPGRKFDRAVKPYLKAVPSAS
jgi:hypothetical protein